MTNFSKELIERLQKYWEKNYGEKITEDTADQYLNSFARLISIFDNDKK